LEGATLQARTPTKAFAAVRQDENLKQDSNKNREFKRILEVESMLNFLTGCIGTHQVRFLT
jgi:hypothetical protein